jgi:hypothetical protein
VQILEITADSHRLGDAGAVIQFQDRQPAIRIAPQRLGRAVGAREQIYLLHRHRDNGSIMIYATNDEREPRVPVRELMQKNLAVYSMSLAGVPHPDRRRAQSDIAAWTASPGRILSVAARFPLYQTAAAHKAVEAGGKVGTVVVEKHVAVLGSFAEPKPTARPSGERIHVAAISGGPVGNPGDPGDHCQQGRSANDQPAAEIGRPEVERMPGIPDEMPDAVAQVIE